MNATIQTETLTDGSLVFNVISNGEQIAHPASMQEALAICDRINTTQPGKYFPEDLVEAEFVCFNDLNHNYNLGPFPCKVTSRADGLLFGNAAKLLQACEMLARLGIETCPRCGGDGLRYFDKTKSEACGQCGGTGKETFNPSPDDIMFARAVILEAKGQ